MRRMLLLRRSHVFLAFWILTASAQTSAELSVSGVVVNGKTGEPVKHAFVEITLY
jgi:hypothetical protein